MKRIYIIIGIIIIFGILGTIYYCIPTKEVKDIYNDFVNSKSYKETKEYYKEIIIKEYAIHDKIIIKTDNGSIKYKFKYKIDENYITYKNKTDDIESGYEYFEFLIDVYANKHSMDKELLHSYIRNLIELNKSSKYFKIEEEGNYTTYKYYIKDKFNIPTLDNIYIKEGDLKDNLDVIDEGFYDELGKLFIHVIRNKDKEIEIDVAELYENTDVTYKTIVNSIKDIKPVNYKEFLNEFTELKEIDSDKYKYSVKKLSDEEAKKLPYYTENYKYYHILFNKK